MPRRFVIHAGFHKTGTSTVQHFLRKNRTALMPHLAIRLKGQMTDLTHAARGYSTWRDPLTLAKVVARFDALLDGLPDMPRRTLVLSGEELSGHMPGRGELSDYGAASELAAIYCEVIAKRFPGTDVAFYFTTRAPAPWLESAYWEHVKSSSMTLDLDAFIARYSRASNLDEVVNAVRAAIPHPVHSTALDGGGDIITDLLDLYAVPDRLRPELARPAPVNTRLPRDLLLELLAANRAYPDRTARKVAKQAILAKGQNT